MSIQFLLISKNPEDLQFGQYLASVNEYGFFNSTDPKAINRLLLKHPKWIVYWDLDDPLNIDVVNTVVTRFVPPTNIFAVGGQELNQIQGLKTTSELFNHYMSRRYSDPAAEIYPKVVRATTDSRPFGVDRFFSKASKSQKITLKRSGHKAAAVEAVQNYVIKNGLNTRLAALVAKATDELIMNAIFDAPGAFFSNSKTDRSEDFPLKDREQVEIEIASCNEYYGISVADNFGTLKKEVAIKFLMQDFTTKAYTPTAFGGAGLGLHGVVASGLSVIFVSKPGVKTEVMLFFPRGKNYKEFRSGFKFLSIFAS